MNVPKWVWPVLAAALVACGVIAYAAANLNSYLSANRERIAERASLAIGRPLRFDRVELSLGRGLGIAVGDLAISEDPQFGTGDFLTTHSAFVQIRILPALLGRYEVARVSLERPTISLIRTGQGTNFEAMGTTKEAPADAATARRQAVAVALLDIENGTIRYVDRTRKPTREITATQVAFRASDLSFGDALRFELSAAVLGAPAANVSASGAVGPVDPHDVSATPLDVTFQLDDIDGDALQAALPAASDLRIQGPIGAKLELGGTVAAWSLNFAINTSRARVAYGTVLDKPPNHELTVAGHLERRSDDTLVADAIDVEIASSTLTITGTAQGSGAATPFVISLKGTGVSLADLAAALPALRASDLQGHADVDVEVIRAANAHSPSIDGRIGLDDIGVRLANGATDISHLSGVLDFKGRSVSLAPTDLRIGGNSARLAARVEDVFAPVVAFDLSTPTLPLAALVENANEDRLDGVASSGRLSLAEATAALDAQVRADAATLRGLPMTSVRATIVRRGGKVRIDPLTFDSCGGSFRGALARADASAPASPSRVEVSGAAARVSLAELAAAVTGMPGRAPASGQLGFELSATGAGDDWSALQRTLTGHGRFDIADGAVLGVNIPETVLERITGVPGLSTLVSPQLREDFPALFGHEDTRFDSLAAGFRIADGRLQTQDLTIKSRDFAIDGTGTLGLDLDVDMAATLTTAPALSSRLVSSVTAMRLLANERGVVAIPFRMTGRLPTVKPQPDLSALANVLQRGLLENLGETLRSGAKPKAGPPSTP